MRPHCLLARIIFGFIASLLAPILITVAQTNNDAKLVFRIDGVITVYEPDTATFRPVTELPRPLGTFALSPDSRYIVYAHEIEEIDTVEDYEVMPKVHNIYLVDLTTGEQQLIAGQPENPTSAADLKVLGFPRWSPDGSQIAWVDGFEAATLYVYDIASGETLLIYERIPPQSLTPERIWVKSWTHSGILIERREANDEFNDTIITSFDMYQLDGTMVSIPNPFDDMVRYWMLDTIDGERIAVNTHLDWYLLDPLNPDAEPQVMTSGRFGYTFMMYPESMVVMPLEIQEDGSYTKAVYLKDGTFVTSLNANNEVDKLSGFTTNRGNTVYVGWDTNSNPVFYDRDGSLYTVEIDNGWTTITPSGQINVLIPDESVYYPLYHCVNTSYSNRLEPSYRGYVLPGSANNMRGNPTTSAELVGSIPAGDWFTVNRGPVCADGFAWWEVDYQDTRGWTVEAGDDGYWLAPCPEMGCVRG